jgi:SAM-dependent methyltransferase
MNLRSFAHSVNFYPGFFGLFLNPFFFARRELLRHVRLCAFGMTGKLLDVGCGKKPYKKLFAGVSEYIGMDIENPGHDHSHEEIDVYYDGKTFPFPDNAFDSVLTNQVFEHVFNPAEFVSEIRRVLKPGGCLLLTVPFVWDEHEQPYDYGRYSSFGLRHILVGYNFEIVQQYKSGTGFQAVVQLFNLFIYKKFYSRYRAINYLLTVLLISPFNLIGFALSIVRRKDSDLYLDNVILARKK